MSMSESVDLDIVDDIIDRARDATSFAQVHDAYTRVLEANGIRPSSDKSYYQFLLKLGMIRARTWGERWDVWRSNNGVSLAPPPVSPRPHPLRARLPFLASASSDLDEGFGADSEQGSEVGVTGRESPRKVMHRSLVGFVPSEADGDVTLPLRTSTPVAAQFSAYRERTRGPSTPTPPPYPESDVSQTTLRSPTDGITPRARNRFMPHLQVVDVPDLDPTVVRQMEAQADAWYRITLLGRCCEWWFKAAERIIRINAQIDSVRTTINLRKALQKWQVATEFRLEQPGTADSHYAARLQSQVVRRWLTSLKERRVEARGAYMAKSKERQVVHGAWISWRAKLAKRTTKRWEEDIREREKASVQRRDARLAAQVFDRWRDQTRERAADKYAVQTTLSRTLFKWHSQTVKLHSLGRRISDWERQHGTAVLADSFRLWRKKSILGPIQHHVSAHRNGMVLARAWSQWRLKTTRQRQAHTFDDTRLINLTLTRMKKSARKARLRNRKAMEFADLRDDELMRSMLTSWVREERSKLLERVIESRRVRGALITWKNKLGKVHELDAKLPPFAEASNVRSLQSALSRWRDMTGQRRNAALKADLIYEARTKASSFVKWTAASAQAAENIATADKAYAFFTLRSVFKKWETKCAQASVERKVTELNHRQRKRGLTAAMTAWRNATAQRIVDRTMVVQFQAKQDQRVLARSLNLWTTRVVEIKARELDMAEQRKVNILSGAFKRWRNARKRQTDLEALMESVIDVKREQILRRSMARWSFRAHLAQDLRHRADFLQAERDQRLLLDTFGTWYDKRRERELRPAEEETRLRHEDALMFSVFDKWVAQSRNLVAVQFDQRRVRASVLPRWQRALERHRELKRVAADHDRRLMVDALSVWKSAYRAKMAKKPYRARRRLQGSSFDESVYGRRSPLDEPRYGRRSPGLPEVERVRERAKPKARPSLPNLGRTPVPRRSLARDASPVCASASVSSEPAYSRLRSELRGPWSGSGREAIAGAASEGRLSGVASRVASGSSRGSEDRQEKEKSPGMSELVRALRGRV
ncbi:hypothetical protein CcaverHIS002_0702710 [Cutaneotrichosporon cavernicola]|uniref:Sfi1 spindle body domain-containing protein n=1 Tax=Cutaneotrichosporon cavernicola TaxID=279322 RepID=A0AA48QYU0_9TREE|nr:uncharacterized protein CcaverHIS019_0702790 [Cutaneotrichosporon cavernicola]BEI86925.1 hypothetical protein CcaverHIS002_0702710 [Cutaneotrichosporon cavernicola]BEI94698.1 hypothetical protein CcaverHIS019_0702790 [Cutaneotrichosporon cavernicola]